MPKYIITTSGDEFFLPDDSHYYLSEMKGKTYIRYVVCIIKEFFGIIELVK